MGKTIYYFINYTKSTVAIGETNPPYMEDRGYTLVDKATYDNYISTNPEYLTKQEKARELRDKRLNNLLKGE